MHTDCSVTLRPVSDTYQANHYQSVGSFVERDVIVVLVSSTELCYQLNFVISDSKYMYTVYILHNVELKI